MKFVHPSRLLKTALLADALVSAAVSAAHLLLTAALSEVLQLPRSLLLETGLVMLVYAALLLWLLRSARLGAALIGLVVAGNMVWALGCLGLLVSGLPPTNALGAGFLWIQAATTLLLAGFQFSGLRASPSVAAARAVGAH
jgi:hypothetical protein